MKNFIYYVALPKSQFEPRSLFFANQGHIIEDSLTNKEDNGFHQKSAIR